MARIIINDIYSKPTPLKPRKKPHRIIASVVLLAVIIGAGSYFAAYQKAQASFGKKTVGTSSQQPITILKTAPTVHNSTTTNTSAALTSAVNQAISNNSNLDIGISYIDLNTNTQINLGDASSFVAASTTKLVTAIDFLTQVEKDTYTLNQTVGDSTASFQLQELINQSDNDSWDAFNNLLTTQQVQDFGQSIGLPSFVFVGDNQIAAADEALLLQKLYEGKLLNDADTKLLLSYMQNTNNDSLIPTALPSNATVYHKYGEIDDDYDSHVGGYLHDAAIININGHNIVLAIYTKDSSGLDEAAQTKAIQDITTAVINNFN